MPPSTAMSRLWRPQLLRRLVMLAVMVSGVALAQVLDDETGALPEALLAALPSGPDAEAVADEAVSWWLDRAPSTLTDLLGQDAVSVCEALPALVLAPPPPQGTRVNVDDRREMDTGDPDRRRFTYSAVRPVDRLDVVQVDLVREGDAWQAVTVGFRTDAATGRAWLAAPATGIAFLVLSVIVVLMLVRPSPLRRALARAMGHVREHRRLVVFTMALLYAAFIAGVWAGASLPPECDDAVLVVLGQALGQVGAAPALAAGDPLRLAVTIFYQNFGVVSLLLFWLGLLFAVPAYLLAVPQFFANGLPFGVLYDPSGPVAVVGTLVLFVVELTAYFLVVAGGGMLLATLLRRGFGAFPLAIQKTFGTLLLAAVLLLLGAWYEVALILLS